MKIAPSFLRLSLLGVCIAHASTARAEVPAVVAPNDNAALHEGAKSMTLQLPVGGNPTSAHLPGAGGMVGMWWMATPALNVGINLGLSIDPQKPVLAPNTRTTTYAFQLVPAAKFYFDPSRVVVPYAYGALGLGFAGVSGPAGSSSVLFNLEGGFGLEYFPTRNFSLGAHAGLALLLARADPGAAVGVDTFTSSLEANLYF